VAEVDVVGGCAADYLGCCPAGGVVDLDADARGSEVGGAAEGRLVWCEGKAGEGQASSAGACDAVDIPRFGMCLSTYSSFLLFIPCCSRIVC